jgi:uncharacterized protein YifE (UPF0438 family)
MSTYTENKDETPLAETEREIETQSQKTRRKYVRGGSRPARVTRISIEQSQVEVSYSIKSLG